MSDATGDARADGGEAGTEPRRSWLALLPASKGTAPGGDGPPWCEVCEPHARRVAEALAIAAAELDDDALVDLLEAPASLVAEVRALAAGIVTAATMPAMHRYTGAVHAAADPASLRSAARRRFVRHVAYLSAVGGLVHADDPLPPYRLPMGANLHGVGPLATFWRDRVEAALAERMTPGAAVWVLTGGEYERALSLPVGLQRIDVSFVEDRRGRDVSPPSAALKQARGLLARRLAQQPGLARDPDGLGWRSWQFEAGLRVFTLEEAGDRAQRWRAVPIARR